MIIKSGQAAESWLRVAIQTARAGLLGTITLAPILGTILALAAHWSRVTVLGIEADTFGMGVLSLFGGWAMAALVYGLLGLTHVTHANTTAFCELYAQLIALEATRDRLCVRPTGAMLSKECAADQFGRYLRELDGALRHNTWGRAVFVFGTGYVSAWQLVHRAEEALISFEPTDNVLRRAHYDLLRLDGARLDSRDLLAADLKEVVNRLDPASGHSHVDHKNGSGSRTIVGTLLRRPALSNGTVHATLDTMDTGARIAVSTARQALNEYRDGNCAGLVRARIQLACTTLLAGLLGYALVWIAITSPAVTYDLLLGALTCYTVGALVGVFSRLQAEFGSNTAVNDFGLSATRHIAAPILSGVAAVLGVSLVAQVAPLESHVPAASVSAAFDLSTNGMSLISAAIFGLTPRLLIERLKQESDGFKENLRTTEPQAHRPT